MTPGWPLKIAALCYPQLQNSISFRGLITIWNGLTCLLVKGLSSSLDCRLNEDRVLVWEEEHRTQSISRINGSEWWVESEGQHSGQHPSSTPPPITHPLTSGPRAVRSQPPPTRPQPSRCSFSHTPAMASNISGPLCSCIPVPEFCPHPAPSQAFGKWTGCKEKPVPPSPSSSHLPYRHARARARTHTHTSGRHGWASTNGDTNYPTGTILALFWDLKLLVSHSQAVSQGSLCWAFLWSSCWNPPESASGKPGPLLPRTCGVTSFQQCQWVTVGTGWHHTWPCTGLSTQHSMNFIIRTRKYRFDASRKRWLRSHFLGIRQITLKWVLVIPTDCISRAISLDEA